MSIRPPSRMDADTFIAWAMEHPETDHCELHHGEIESMAVAVGEKTVSEPDIVVRCGERLPDDADRCSTMILGDQLITLDPPGIVLRNIVV